MALEGQIALVTGASSGIGRATAVALASEGATVVLSGRRRGLLEDCAAEIAAGGGVAEAAPLDVTDEPAVEACVADLLRRHGRLDLLVSAAGKNTTRRNLRDLTTAEWRLVLDANLTGPYLLVRATLPSMRARGAGTIVVVGSAAALFPGPMSGVGYSASKAGVSALVKSINAEERRFGIRACAIQVGEVDTPIMDLRPFPPTAEDLARMLKPEDVAAAIVYAASQPQWVNVEEIFLRPTALRSGNEYDRLVARWEGEGR